jgi:LacI family transcriptional regulator
MRVTIRDVAREAGVSVATVSRVFNDSGPVSEQARLRILEAAQRLRYAPNEAARTLINRRSQAIGALLPDLHGEFFSEVMRGLDRAAQRAGHHLLVSGSHDDRAAVEGALRAMRGRVDGLVLMFPDVEAAALAPNLPTGIPIVLLNCPSDACGPVDTLAIDNFGGARAMTRHLLDVGHRRIAILTGTLRNHDALERLRGFGAALRDGGGETHDRWRLVGDFTEASGYDATRRLLRERERPEAIFASNDSMAIGALAALHEAGIEVPLEMAVAGFDDIPMARYLSPPLTSVHAPAFELGGRAIGRLLDALERPPRRTPRHETLPTRLVVRSSCGAAALQPP